MAAADRIVKRYLREAKKNCPRALRSRLDVELKTSLLEFYESNNNITTEMIEKRFGNPKQYAAEYLSLCDANVIGKKLESSKKIKITVFTLIIIVLLALAATMLYIIEYNKTTNPTYIYIDVEEESNFEKTH